MEHFIIKQKNFGCDFIATGHYAKIEYSKKYKQYILKKSKEEKKDQTYFLYTVPKEELEHIIFPLQNYTSKDDIRKIAEENNLAVANKKDSQEICFIPNGNYKDFLMRHLEEKQKSGNIVLKNGEVLGKHNGLINYTIGQRKGLGISYKEPLYVVDLDKEKNQVVVGIEKDLYSKSLTAKNLNWLVPSVINDNKKIECYAKIRYRAKEAQAVVYLNDKDVAKVEFVEPQRAITQGQSVVFYDEDGVVLGGGIIDNEIFGIKLKQYKDIK